MIYQIYYKEDHKKEIYPFAIPYYNEGLTIFFETEVIKRIVPTVESEKVAVCSWKLAKKMWNVGQLTQDTLKRDFEVLSFTKNGREHRMLGMLNTWHPKGLEALNLLWKKLGYRRPMETKQPVYQNHYAAKTDIYKRYVTEFLTPAHEMIEKDEELNGLMMLESNYGRLARDADSKSVKNKLGLDSYPLCPFVLERCPSLWFDMHNIKVSYL